MEDVVSEVLQTLTRLEIPYDLIRHPPAASIEECRPIGLKLGAPILKNLFLTTRRKGGYYLLVMRPDAAFSAGAVSRQAGTSRLCFAAEETLNALLRERSGSVSPLGLIFDREGQVKLLLDSRLRGEARLAFHPCLNTYSLAVGTGDFLNRFLPFTGHAPQWIDIDDMT